jgi:hypothetical protein
VLSDAGRHDRPRMRGFRRGEPRTSHLPNLDVAPEQALLAVVPEQSEVTQEAISIIVWASVLTGALDS